MYFVHKGGALDGGPQCRLLDLRNCNVPWCYLCIVHVDCCKFCILYSVHIGGALDRGGGGAMSHVEFKKCQCPLVLFVHCPCVFKTILISHVEFMIIIFFTYMFFQMCNIVLNFNINI